MRIAGVVNAEPTAVWRVLEAMTAQVPTTNHTRAIGPASLGVATWSARVDLELSANVVACVDGALWSAAYAIEQYRARGFVDALAQLDGDFALALYDHDTATLWLARDRFGVKPLYFSSLRGRFAFASRTRGLLALPDVSAEPNHAFVARFAGLHYRTFDNLPHESPYRAIAQLPAASYLEVREGVIHRQATYWELSEQPELEADEATLAELYRGLLLEAVGKRRRAADRPAFTLSGGMDSSSVIACSVAATGHREQAFSTVYSDDATYDETAEIQSILDATVEQWHPVRIGNPDLATLIPRMIDANDEPIATATWLSHYLLCEEAHRAGFGSLFGGLGGDELNAGEYEYFFFFFADLAYAGDPRLDHETAKWVEYHDHPIFTKSAAVMRAGLERLVDLRTPGVCRADPARLARYRDLVRPEYYDLTRYEPVMDTPFTSYLKNRTHQDIFRETAPCCLRAADRQSAAFGLDVSWPFFDHRLAELMFRVPGTLKIRDGVTKHLLRAAMKDIVPEATRTRIKKTGWNAPAHVWFATGSGRELVLDLTASQAFRDRGIYDVAAVQRLLDEHREIVTSGRAVDNHMMFFWQLVNLELWLAR